MMANARLVLASGSPVRRDLLEKAGLAFAVDPANVDEASVLERMTRDGAPAEAIAQALADLKAFHVAERHAGAFVLGADQVLECEGRLFMKPAGAQEAADHLRRLRGKTHRLVCALTVVRNGAAVWRHGDTAILEMRDVSDDFLNGFVARNVPDILSSVGAYRLEDEGIQLFSRIDGSFFTILGLPLLPLLDFLRMQGVVQE